MATYLFGLTSADVDAVVAHNGGIGSDSDPSSTATTAMLNRFAGEFGIAFRDRYGVSASVLTEADYPDQYHAVRGRIVARAAAEWLDINQRLDNDIPYVADTRASWLSWLRDVSAGVLGSVGEALAQSSVTGTFDSQRIITRPSSREPRRPESSEWWGQ